jgi:hypothetical protein
MRTKMSGAPVAQGKPQETMPVCFPDAKDTKALPESP